MVEIILLRDSTVGCVRLQTHRQLPASILCSMYDNASSLFDVRLTGAPAVGKKSMQPIRAHKAVLAHASPHLRDLFTSQGYADSNKSKYTIPSIDHDTLRTVVKLIYTGNVLLAGDDAVERVRGLLIGAKYLIMKDLIDACETFFASSEQIDVTNCVDMFQFAFKFNCTKISSAVCTYIAENLVAVSQSAKFLNLSRDECAKFLLSDPVIAASADDRCRAAIAWLNHNSPLRAESAECIMSMAALDAAGVKPETLLLAAQSPVIRPTIKGVASALIDALAGTVRKHQLASHVEGERKKSKAGYSRGEAWYVIGGKEHIKDFYHFDVVERQWSTLRGLPWERVGGACAVGKRLIVIGGLKNNDPAIDIDEFDTVTQTWSSSKTKFSRPCDCMAVTADSKHAYALGGCDFVARDTKNRPATNSSRLFDYASRYCAETRTIDELASMSTARDGACAVSRDDDMIFVVGGNTGSTIYERRACKTIDKYDYASNSWFKIGTLREACGFSAATLLGDDLYMAGDIFWRKNVEIFNTRTGQQRAAPEMRQSRSGCSAVSLDNNVLCVLGGKYWQFNEEVPLRSVESLDVREGKWSIGTVVPDMPKANVNFGFARVRL